MTLLRLVLGLIVLLILAHIVVFRLGYDPHSTFHRKGPAGRYPACSKKPRASAAVTADSASRKEIDDFIEDWEELFNEHAHSTDLCRVVDTIFREHFFFETLGGIRAGERAGRYVATATRPKFIEFTFRSLGGVRTNRKTGTSSGSQNSMLP